jgi:thioredoxin-dependent adenylylsulfate APS reductase
LKQKVVSTALEVPGRTKIRQLADEYEHRSAEEVLEWALATYGRLVAISTSFQAEGMVIFDMAHRIDPDVRVLTIDTGRLPQETYDLIDRVREHYDVSVEVIYPNQDELSQMVSQHGLSPFYRSVSLRLLCCNIRKVNPLNRALKDLDAWITGLRRGQGETRARTRKIEVDVAHGGITKVNPLADWSSEQVWDYVRSHDVPYNELYDKGYTSIGCAPCTRPIETGEDMRAGRWWWENGMPKECGIHLGAAWGRTV